MKIIGLNFFLFLLTMLLLIAELSFGSADIPLSEIWQILKGNQGQNPSWEIIVLQSRMPRALAAMAAGASLSISGLMMQTLFRNPLAGPHILGVSSGAGLGVALYIMGFGALGVSVEMGIGKYMLLMASMLGGMVVLAILFTVSLRVRDMLTVLIVGILMSSAAMALVGILQYLSPEDQVKSFVIWTLGSFDGVSLDDARVFLPISGLLLLSLVFLLKALNLLLAGEEYALSMGLNVRSARLQIMMLAGALTAIVTAYCGPIGFIGVIVPHFSRMALGSNDHKVLWISTMLMGVNLLLFADLLSHLPGSARILPVNSITSLIGIPFIFWMLLRKKVIHKL